MNILLQKVPYGRFRHWNVPTYYIILYSHIIQTVSYCQCDPALRAENTVLWRPQRATK